MECSQLESEFVKKKKKLKDDLKIEKLDEEHRIQSNIEKLEVDASNVKKSLDEKKEHYEVLSKTKNLTATSSSSSAKNESTARIVFCSIVTTRSKKKQLVPKLRPRLNGRASTVSPVSENGISNKVKSSWKNPRNMSKVIKEKPAASTVQINRKPKQTSIENKLKIKFMLSEDEIDDDLKDLMIKLI